MFVPGLVSITFRQFEPDRVVDLVEQAGLCAIEWGGDVHAPPSDLKKVRSVADISRAAGLETPVYGSYYSLGEHSSMDEFERNIEAASILGATMIRIWAGRMPLDEVDDALFARMVEEAQQMCELAQRSGISVVPEWHGNSLLENTDSALRFFGDVNHPALVNFWQPHQHLSPALRLKDLTMAALSHLRGLHVFQWSDGWRVRHPLEEGRDEWMEYLKASATTGRQLYALLEFVKDNDPNQFLADAETLKGWLLEVAQYESVSSR